MGAKYLLRWKVLLGIAPLPSLVAYTEYRKHITNIDVVSTKPTVVSWISMYRMWGKVTRGRDWRRKLFFDQQD